MTDKQRRKTGEVSVSKRVETDTAEVSVPVEKEKIVIEITTSSGQTPQVTAGNAEISEGEVVQMDVHEETANIRKQAVVREEINIRKEVERDTVTAKETVRREELDVDTSGKPDVVNRGNRNRS